MGGLSVVVGVLFCFQGDRVSCCQDDKVTVWEGGRVGVNVVVVLVLCGFQGDRVSWCQGDRVTGWGGGRVMRFWWLWCGFCAGVTVTECQGCGSSRKDFLLCDCIMKILYCVGSTIRNSLLCSFTTTNYCVLVSDSLISLCSGFKLFDFTVMASDF